MKNANQTRHATYIIKYHLVWITKYRREILTGEIAEEVESILKKIAIKNQWEIISLSIQPDHVHIFVSVPPKMAPADLVKIFKGASARYLLSKYPHLGIKSQRSSLWAPSYYIGTAGNISSNTISKYIDECQDH